MAERSELHNALTVLGIDPLTIVPDADGTIRVGAPDAAVTVATVSRPLVGEGGELEIGRTLGEGGTGIVRAAVQVPMEREVAVKSVAERHGPVAARELVREARITGSLEHPNVVPVHALGTDESGNPLIVMKRIAGASWSIRGVTRAIGVLVALMALACAKPPPPESEPDLGPIDVTVDPGARAVWPGVDEPDGGRTIRRRVGFHDGQPVPYWVAGPATRATADVFWSCRRGDPACPFDARGALDWSAVVGGPIFARIPGEAGYSPYWLAWVVEVGPNHGADAIKSVAGLEAAEAAGEVTIRLARFDHGPALGVDAAVMNCLLVLHGTILEGNGGPLPGRPGTNAYPIAAAGGWHKGYRVQFFDFTPTEGVIPPDVASQSRPQMPAADLYVLARDCAGGSDSPACAATDQPVASLREDTLGLDLTGDGDLDDSNDLLSSVPGVPGYTALWRLRQVVVPAGRDGQVDLLDSGGPSAVTSLEALEALWATGRAEPPRDLEPSGRVLTVGETLVSGAVQVAIGEAVGGGLP